MNLYNSILYLISNNPVTAETLHLLFKTVRIQVLVYETPVDYLQAPLCDHQTCLIIDLEKPSINYLELLVILKKKHKHIPVVFITDVNDLQGAISAMKLGACDFILKPYNDQYLVETVQKCLKNSNPSLKNAKDKVLKLSEREQQIMNEIVEGKVTKEIAQDLAISISTVEAHRKKIMSKMNAKNMAQLIAYYYKAKLNQSTD